MLSRLLLVAWIVGVTWAQKPQLFLLETFEEDKNLSGWVMSEKLDGVRAYWDGKRLLSRSGKSFAAPAWFVEQLPPFAVDGELYTHRGDFERITSIVNQSLPHEGWRAIVYHIFEVPHAKGTLYERLALAKSYEGKHLHVVAQLPCASNEAAFAFRDSVVREGGEGIVVRDPHRGYETGRLSSALKLKPYEDAECKVTGYTQGKGKYAHQVGALLCAYGDQVLKIGTGLSDAMRAVPPPLGSTITFSYKGTTGKGVPKSRLL
ncbi:MAG: hypothetical protein KU28_00410 [Sulfurovum sp. PC08-66]|nr:MAG: hypothetical protein KU28_00410 [Sulfurovum sp. PC08-66]KIM12432.1 MAG: hypothetical protein KU37_00530 [Sulfuricurvum sp. PC08-66]